MKYTIRQHLGLSQIASKKAMLCATVQTDARFSTTSRGLISDQQHRSAQLSLALTSDQCVAAARASCSAPGAEHKHDASIHA